MFARLRNSLFLLAAFLLLTSVSWAQVSSLEGDVKDENGAPLKGALITIDRLDMKGHYQVKTDKKGHYYYGGLPLGKYKVAVSVDGKERDSVNNVQTKFGDTAECSFDLRKVAQQQTAMNNAAASGQLTKEQERGMSTEQKAAVEGAMKKRQEQIAKNKELNDAYNSGREALTAKNYPTAIEQLTKASTIDANQPAVWTSLADAYLGEAATKTGADQQADYDKGLEAYQKAIELKPDDAAMHMNYGIALAKAKKVDEGKAELEKSAALDPAGAAKAYKNLGIVMYNNNNFDAAAESLKKSIDLNGNDPDTQYWYAMSLSSKLSTGADGKVVAPPGMAEALQKYLELAPNGPNADGAKSMLATIQGGVSTSYANPNAKKKSR